MADCVEWDGTRDGRGYGVFKLNGKFIKAHRAVWEMFYGPIPAGMFICHHCDNPPCVQIDHLFVGTPGDNVRDMIDKGRARYVTPTPSTTCSRGHDKGRFGMCPVCHRDRAREWYRQNVAKTPPKGQVIDLDEAANPAG